MKALALVDAPDHVCCRYRITAFQPALDAAGCSLTTEGLAHGWFARWSQFRRASAYDTVILQRKLLPRWQLRALRERARRLIFDFDDAVLYRDSYDGRGPHCRRREARFSYTVEQADTVLAGNDFLADCALRAGAAAERIRVIPSCVDTGRYSPRATGQPGTGLELVWIGSSSTLQGLEQQRALWELLGREVPGIRLRLICDRFPQFESMPVIPVAWSEATEAREMACADVGISWLPDDLWSRGKCGLKIVQYQAAGLPVITNPIGVHPEMVVDGVSGFLARTPGEWVQAAQTLAADSALRRRMGNAARAGVESGYSISAWSRAFVEAIAESGTKRPADAPPGPKLYKLAAAKRGAVAPNSHSSTRGS